MPALLVHGSFGWGTETYAPQVDLADSYRIHLLDRAGFGDSPPATEPGWPTDMHEVADLLGEIGPAHLVGVSYGGVVALLAAGLRPDAIRSLVVVEPPLLGAAPHDPAAAQLAGRLRNLDARTPSMDTVEYFVAWSRAVLHRERAASAAASASWSARVRAAVEASRRERSPVDAPVDLPALAALDVPKVVAVGGWPSGDMAARTAGRAFRAVAGSLVERIGAEMVVFDKATHNPQLQQPDEFNAMLRRVWSVSGD